MAAQFKLRTSSYWHIWNTNSITINLTTHTEGPRDGVGNPAGEPCRSIVVTKAGVGTLVLKKLNGTVEKFTSLVSGQEIPVQAAKIRGVSSSFSEILVLW